MTDVESAKESFKDALSQEDGFDSPFLSVGDIETAISALDEKQERDNGWIKIDPDDDSTLPKEPDWYYTYSEDEFCRELLWNCDCWYNDQGDRFENVTHWQPLPEPPREKK